MAAYVYSYVYSKKAGFVWTVLDVYGKKIQCLCGFQADSMDGAGRPWNHYYFPMQKLEKISPSKSSLVNFPVMLVRLSCASRSSSANKSSTRSS